MTVYVDPIVRHPSGPWCHLATDGKPGELHDFAARLNLRRSWFQDHRLVPHYDLKPSRRDLALELGAEAVPAKELLRRCRRPASPADAR